MIDPVKVDSVLIDLMQASHVGTLEELPGMVAGRADMVGLHHMVIFLADLQGQTLRQVTGLGPDAGAG
ncbi:hypothetical protein [Streptomyces sp. H62]